MGVISYGSGGMIYAALFDDGLVKIGCTRNAKKRQQTLSSSAPRELVLFITAESRCHNLRADETSFHELFAEKRVRGEYFKFDFIDWLEWFYQWDCAKWAYDEGLLPHISEMYNAEDILTPEFLEEYFNKHPGTEKVIEEPKQEIQYLECGHAACAKTEKFECIICKAKG